MSAANPWIHLVESAYRLDGSMDEWLDRLAEAASPLLSAGLGVVSTLIALEPMAVHIQSIRGFGTPLSPDELARGAIESGQQEALDQVFRSGIPASSMSEAVFSQIPGSAERFAQASNGFIQDTVGVVADGGRGLVLSLSAPSQDYRLLTQKEKHRLSQVTAHIAAALRLREQLDGSALDTKDAEAILTPDGSVQSLDAATDQRALQLSAAVRAMAEAKRDDHDDPSALDIWQGLVCGEWSLVDYVDTDRKRFVLARRNPIGTFDERGLTLRETQVAEGVGHGFSNKQIAYSLGVSQAAVSNALMRVRQKLRLKSRAEVVSFFSPDGLRQRLRSVSMNEDELAIGDLNCVDQARLAQLSLSEQEVALAMLQGATNASIASARGVSERTIANQVQSIFRKLGANSRVQLAARLSKAPHASQTRPATVES